MEVSNLPPSEVYSSQGKGLFPKTICNSQFEIKKGRLITSHRYNRLSLLPSGPGEVEQELVV
jgi:hypothetical protein